MALEVEHRRLRIAAEAVIEAATDGDPERPIHDPSLAALRRELAGEPQPSGMAWMSVSATDGSVRTEGEYLQTIARKPG